MGNKVLKPDNSSGQRPRGVLDLEYMGYAIDSPPTPTVGTRAPKLGPSRGMETLLGSLGVLLGRSSGAIGRSWVGLRHSLPILARS